MRDPELGVGVEFVLVWSESVTVLAAAAQLSTSSVTSPAPEDRVTVAGSVQRFRVEPQDAFGNAAIVQSGTLTLFAYAFTPGPRIPSMPATFEAFQQVITRHPLSNLWVSQFHDQISASVTLCQTLLWFLERY